MRSQSLSDYPPGTTVFAKLKGYPWWPARIEDDQTVPSKVMKQKAKTKGPLWTVFFYGSKDYGFFGPDAIRPFDRPSVERDLKGNKFKNKDLEKAVRQALDPALLAAEMMGDEEGDESEAEEKPPPTRGRKRVSPRKKATTNGKKRGSDAEEEILESPKAKTRIPKGEDEDVSASEGVENKPNKRRKASSAETSQTNTLDETPELERSPQFLKIRYLRHKLQKLVYDKRPGEIPSDDFPKIVEALDDIEEQNSIMTYDLLRSTKIARVVKSAFKYKGDADYKAIQDRCRTLLERWRARFEQKSQPTTNIPSSAEETKSEEQEIKHKDAASYEDSLSTFPPLINKVNPEDKR